MHGASPPSGDFFLRMSAVRLPARLALEDGWTALGMAVGAAGTATGECVFNTCLSGYEEVLTDPSYTGQLVVMTYPLIGNYGITIEDGESDGPQVAGFVMRECVQEPSSWRAVETLPVHLERNGVVAIEGIDTRALTRHLRERGALRGIISTELLEVEPAVARAASIATMEGQDLTGAVSCPTATVEGDGELLVAAFDLGLKQNIVRRLNDGGCRVVRLPVNATPEAVLELEPDGLFVSNGPGDPAAVGRAIATLESLASRAPWPMAARRTSSSLVTTAGIILFRNCRLGGSTSRLTTTGLQWWKRAMERSAWLPGRPSSR